MAGINKEDSRLRLQFVANSDHSIHAGLVAVEALARRFDLWNKLRQLPCLDPRKDKRRGYGPEVIVGQLPYALGSGGGCDNRWTGPLERAAQALRAWAWTAQGKAHYAWVRHQPQDRNAPQLFAVIRRREGLLDRSGFIACDEGQTDPVWVSQRHQLKGDKEQLFREGLNGLDLHRPPCMVLMANQVYYLMAALAYNLMVAIKLLDLPDDCQGWRVKTLMKKRLWLPGRLAWRSRRWVARVRGPGAGLCGWQRWAQRVWPSDGPGRARLLAARR